MTDVTLACKTTRAAAVANTSPVNTTSRSALAAGPALDISPPFIPMPEAPPKAAPNGIRLKPLFDVPLALLLLTMLAIPMMIVAALIKLDSSGPVFFRQPRIGLNNQVFSVWKFRSMYHANADAKGSQLTSRNDPRVTRLGAFLRKTSIDELPQLFNVVAGSMSLVGPRPHPLNAKVGAQLYADVVPNYWARHSVLPGITGWAQVRGWRGETIVPYQLEQRVAHDFQYIANWSLWFDVRILLLTMKSEIVSRYAF